ncbi:MAG: DUF362 domain-containing protein [Prolixibacteraceae bacterium]|jgi:hypothetical protein|nr:DUF362 domain-containing protein [Prolixibacteraceae bacterium]
MKRRDFIHATAGLSVLGFLPKGLAGSVLMSEDRYVSEAYDDNKVVRVYNQNVSDYNFSGEQVYWKTINKDVLTQMLSKSLFEISGEKKVAKAWKKILEGNKNANLVERKIVVKVNFNNTIRDINKTLNNSPAMLSVLAKSLIDAGLQQKNICIFDCSRPFPKEIKSEVRKQNLEQIVMIGKNDNPAVSEKTIFLSDNKGFPKDGKPTDQYPIPQLLIDADYLVNLHLVKMHSPGVTGAMKNLFGILGNVGFYMHKKETKSFSVSNQLPDISLNEEIKKRARLNIAEFVFGGHTPDSVDKFTNEAFFPNGMPASLIVSRSPFYHDTVLYSFINAEYQTCKPENLRKDLATIGPDTWLKNSSERYPAWKYEQAGSADIKKEGHPLKELTFKGVNYVSV